MFHIKLKEKRMQQKKTQKELADYLNISPQSISKWEKGEALPSLEYLPKIAHFLHCDINAFFADDTTQNIDSEGVEGVSDNHNFTELVFILDKSGSMSLRESDTIGGFNSMIEEQKAVEGEALVSTILFSNRIKVLHDRKPLTEIQPMTLDDYRVGGNTALLDAIGSSITHIEHVYSELRKSNREKEVPCRTIFVITTDGHENSSREYSSDVVKSMIKSKQEIDGWEFLFIAANIDAVETAGRIGIKRNRATNYNIRKSTGMMFEETSRTLSEYRTSGMIREDWSKKLEEENY